MYLKRKIDSYLVKWKQDQEHLPLVIRGARQVGKTEAIRNFARQNYSSVVEVNFAEEPEYKSIISEGYKADTIIRLLSRQNPSFRFPPGETLLFFDELQAFPEIIAVPAARKKRRISLPSSERTGMFCRFGSVEEMRPVRVSVWLSVEWIRPSGEIAFVSPSQ